MADGGEACGPRLRAVEVEFAYSGEKVLHRVSVEIAPGAVTALVGPNGSGKSTLLSALARLLRPTAGAVELDGRAIGSQPTREVARRLAILPQTVPLPENVTVFDLVSRGRFPHLGRLGRWSEADLALVEQAMHLTGVLDYARRPVDGLSGGQRQRAWIAMALAQQTPIILLDEPTSALDLRYQLEILDLLRRLSREHGRTIVIAMHDLNLAASHADRMIFFRAGQVQGAGPAAEICTPELIEAVFGVRVLPLRHPRSGHPVFVPDPAP